MLDLEALAMTVPAVRHIRGRAVLRMTVPAVLVILAQVVRSIRVRAVRHIRGRVVLDILVPAVRHIRGRVVLRMTVPAVLVMLVPAVLAITVLVEGITVHQYVGIDEKKRAAEMSPFGATAFINTKGAIMATEQEICQVIKSRQQMVYTCQGEKHVEGERYGNPHILYRSTRAGRVMVDVWKTGGVQTRSAQELPGWRAYRLEDIVLLNCKGNFSPESTFKPDAKKYAETICSV